MSSVIEEPSKKVWTREEAARLAELFPGQRYELIQGELIDKTGQKPPHAYVIARLNEILSVGFSGRIRIQLPITLPGPEGVYSEPEPDVVLLREHTAGFFDRHPGPDDIALAIEVADTTLNWDRHTKGSLYSRAGIRVLDR